MKVKNNLTNFEIDLAKELLKVFDEQKENERVTIEYTDLAKRLGNNIQPKNLGKFLGAVSEFCYNELNLPFISAIVVNKETKQPGEGFYDMLCRYRVNQNYENILEEVQTRKDWHELKEYLDRY